ncbi:MAG: hypothetical protein KJ077_46125 [Anaerolineae bacterium]|nr:hypothetical protein [Anaerolineae bacterium]
MTELTLQPVFLGQEAALTFSDESERLTAVYKQRIFEDWRRFLYSGFKKVTFTTDLYRFLVAECSLIGRYNQDYFWSFHCAAASERLRFFLGQFGGNGRSVDFGTLAWLGGPAADLKHAMCAEAGHLYAPLIQVLTDLEHKHAELGQAWRNFALNSGLPDPGFPQQYLVSENTRNLLAYAASIVSAEQSRPPLQGLQLDFSVPLLLDA